MAITVKRYDPVRGFKFELTLFVPGGGLIRGGFMRISGLKAETEVVEYREGTDLSTVRKLPGLTTYDNITLERGQIFEGQDDLLAWRKQIVTALTDGDAEHVGDELRADGTIFIYNKEGTPIGKYKFYDAWPTIYEHTDLDATASDVWTERVELAHEGLEFFGLTFTPTE